MTEREWLACADPDPMLEFLSGKSSDRKVRLFGCACCRRVWHLLTDKHARKALAVAERYADGDATKEKLKFAWGNARQAAQRAFRRGVESAEGTTMWAVAEVCEGDVSRVAVASGYAARSEAHPLTHLGLAPARAHQAALLREVFGNPFRFALDREWLTPDVVALGRGIYADRAFDRMPILADALQDAGCNDEEVLNHCRSPGVHVRGCWVLDLVLGKE